jgi:hypothetical protein
MAASRKSAAADAEGQRSAWDLAFLFNVVFVFLLDLISGFSISPIMGMHSLMLAHRWRSGVLVYL